eukprot:comp23277_c0_seq2/m.38109 comp23277_c0_seq2/g.38109  ORF comp23277_c0_seq2/g.38109 comp23277_c0_seq2/m.38109 type:complete len:1219 (-) comp23277_c0_seq2:650-4306(-)
MSLNRSPLAGRPTTRPALEKRPTQSQEASPDVQRSSTSPASPRASFASGRPNGGEGDGWEESAPEVSPRPQRPKNTLAGEDYTSYVMALRCFINPLSNLSDVTQEEQQRSHYLKKWVKSHITTYRHGHDDLSRKLSKEDVARLLAAIDHQVTESGRDVMGNGEEPKAEAQGLEDGVYVAALGMFAKVLRTDMAALEEKGRNTCGHAIDLFGQCVQLEMQRAYGRADMDSILVRKEKFGNEFLDMQHQAQSRNSPNPTDTVRSDSQRSTPAKKDPASVSLAEQHNILGRAYGLPANEHLVHFRREERINSSTVVAEELKMRLAQVDSHPYYNKETFLSKTAAFLKWRAAEEQTVKDLLKVLEQPISDDSNRLSSTSLIADRSPSMLRAGSIGSIASSISDRLHRSNSQMPEYDSELIVGVLRARNLAAKDKDTGKSDPYCIVECNGEARQTRVIECELNPVWQEACNFVIKAKDEGKPLGFKLAVWDKDEVQDDFLGQLEIEKLNIEELQYPQERWYKLQKRSARSHVSGDIQLRLEYVSGRKKAEQARQQAEAQGKAREEKEREEQEKKRKEDAQRATNRPDYHKIYEQLAKKVIEGETERYRQGHGEGEVLTVPLWFRALSEEYGLRHGVGRLYRTMVDTAIMAKLFDAGSIDVVAMRIAMEDMHSQIRVEDVKWTKLEQQMCIQVMASLEALCTMHVGAYKDFFPLGGHDGHLTAYIESLALVLDAPMYKPAQEQTIEKALTKCVEMCSRTVFNRHAAMATPLSINPTPQEITIMLSTLVDSLVQEVEADALYFEKEFRVGDKPAIDLLQTVAATYSALMADTVQDIMERNFKRAFSPALMPIYFKLKKYNQSVAGLDSSNTAFKGFELASTFKDYIVQWLQISRQNAITWASTSMARDTLEPVSPTTPHSASAVDIFCCLSEVLEFLQRLDWDDKDQYAQFIYMYSEIMSTVLQLYLEEVSRSTRNTLLQTVRPETSSKKDTKRFLNIAQVCVLFNNVEAAGRQTSAMCHSLGFGTLTLWKGTEGQRRSSMVLSHPEGNQWEGETRQQFKKMAECLHTTWDTMTSYITARTKPVVAGALRIVAGNRGYFEAFSSLFSQPSKGGGNMEVQLQPVTSMMDEIMSATYAHMYMSAAQRLGQGVWGGVVVEVQVVVTSGDYSETTGLASLKDALEYMYGYFYAGGDGVPETMLQTTNYKCLGCKPCWKTRRTIQGQKNF